MGGVQQRRRRRRKRAREEERGAGREGGREAYLCALASVLGMCECACSCARARAFMCVHACARVRVVCVWVGVSVCLCGAHLHEKARVLLASPRRAPACVCVRVRLHLCVRVFNPHRRAAHRFAPRQSLHLAAFTPYNRHSLPPRTHYQTLLPARSASEPAPVRAGPQAHARARVCAAAHRPPSKGRPSTGSRSAAHPATRLSSCPPP